MVWLVLAAGAARIGRRVRQRRRKDASKRGAGTATHMAGSGMPRMQTCQFGPSRNCLTRDEAEQERRGRRPATAQSASPTPMSNSAKCWTPMRLEVYIPSLIRHPFGAAPSMPLNPPSSRTRGRRLAGAQGPLSSERSRMRSAGPESAYAFGVSGCRSPGARSPISAGGSKARHANPGSAHSSETRKRRTPGARSPISSETRKTYPADPGNPLSREASETRPPEAPQRNNGAPRPAEQRRAGRSRSNPSRRGTAPGCRA